MAELQRKIDAEFRDADIIEMWLQHEFPAAMVAVRQPIRQPGEKAQAHPRTAIVDL